MKGNGICSTCQINVAELVGSGMDGEVPENVKAVAKLLGTEKSLFVSSVGHYAYLTHEGSYSQRNRKDRHLS